MNPKHRVLWLEDDLEAGHIFASELDHATYVVQLVPSIEELNSALADPRDLVILDLQLGNTGWAGLDALANFRQYNRVTPVLVCTGKGAKREVKKAFQLGADDVIFKEDVSQEFCSIVERLVDPDQRFRDILEQFPTPLAYLGRRFTEASTQLEKLRLTFDLFETALKLIAIYCFAELDANSCWPEQLLTHLRQKILLTPSIGDWQVAVSYITALESDLLHEICNCAQRCMGADKLINVLKDAVSARNTLFGHGITPSESSCRQNLQTWWPRFFKFLTRCTPLHTHSMVFVETLELTQRGFIANTLRIQGSSLLMAKDAFECIEPPFTGQISLRSSKSTSVLSLHPWVRLGISSPSGYTVCIYDKIFASTRIEGGQRLAQPTDQVEYLDLVTGAKVKMGTFSEFKILNTQS